MKNQHVQYSDRPQPNVIKETDKPSVRRQRVPLDTRRQVVDDVMDGRCNGAEAARTYGVSEATVHRLVTAEQIVNPRRVMVVQQAVWSTKDRHAAAEAARHSSRQGRQALTRAQEREVIERFYRGSDLPTDLAHEFGVHKSTISRILRAARTQCPFWPMPEFNTVEWQRRVDQGVARAIAAGRRPGAKLRLSVETQNAIVLEVDTAGASFKSVARKYGVNPSTVGRLVRALRIHLGPDNPQSLDEIFSDLMRK